MLSDEFLPLKNQGVAKFPGIVSHPAGENKFFRCMILSAIRVRGSGQKILIRPMRIGMNLRSQKRKLIKKPP